MQLDITNKTGKQLVNYMVAHAHVAGAMINLEFTKKDGTKRLMRTIPQQREKFAVNHDVMGHTDYFRVIDFDLYSAERLKGASQADSARRAWRTVRTETVSRVLYGDTLAIIDQ